MRLCSAWWQCHHGKSLDLDGLPAQTIHEAHWDVVSWEPQKCQNGQLPTEVVLEVVADHRGGALGVHVEHVLQDGRGEPEKCGKRSRRQAPNPQVKNNDRPCGKAQQFCPLNQRHQLKGCQSNDHLWDICHWCRHGARNSHRKWCQKGTNHQRNQGYFSSRPDFSVPGSG